MRVIVMVSDDVGLIDLNLCRYFSPTVYKICIMGHLRPIGAGETWPVAVTGSVEERTMGWK